MPALQWLKSGKSLKKLQKNKKLVLTGKYGLI